MTLLHLNKNFRYTSDGKSDRWVLMKEGGDGKLRGDCEDYSIWVLYWLLCGGSWFKFWTGLLTRKYKIHFVRVRADRAGHAILEHKGKFIDNNFQRWVNKETMEQVYKFRHVYFVTSVAYKMLLGKFDPPTHAGERDEHEDNSIG